MQKRIGIILSMLFAVNAQAACPDSNIAVQAIESAAKALGTTTLGQSDFASGSYRIRSGGYYQLRESVDFNPDPILSAARTDRPLQNWFCAISVETSENVVIDLNGFTISESQAYLNARQVIIFSIIELDNSIFSGILFPQAQQAGFTYQGEVAFVSAENVVVKNGTVTRSGHWAVHGGSNVNAHLRDLTISDCQVANINLSAATNCSIQDCNLSGLKQVITTRGIQATVATASQLLAGLTLGGFPGAGAQLVALQAYVAANPAVFSSPITEPEGNAFYGIFINLSGQITGSLFPLTNQACATQAIVGGEPAPSCVDIRNITLNDFIGAPIEVPAIGSNQAGGPFANLIFTAAAGIIGTLRWQDAYDAMGNFNPNPYLQALAFAIKAAITLNPPLAAQFPPNVITILDAILAGPAGRNDFLANAIPIMGLDIQQGPMKGVFAIRYDCASNGVIENIRYNNIRNNGNPGIEISSLPDGEFYSFIPPTRYNGNDLWALELAADNNIIVNNHAAVNIITVNGDSFAYDAIQDCANITQTCLTCTNVQGQSDSQTTVNPPSEAYGFRVRNNVGPVPTSLCTSFNVVAPRIAFGIAAEGTTGVVFTNCAANNTFATSTNPEGPNPKEAFGFYSDGSTNTQFQSCLEANARILGEDAVQEQTDSVAAGYAFDDEDSGSTVNASVANNNHSGGGIAAGVYIAGDSENTTVTNNKLTNNIADKPFAQGYGILDTAPVSSAIISGNTFGGNSTADIQVN